MKECNELGNKANESLDSVKKTANRANEALGSAQKTLDSLANELRKNQENELEKAILAYDSGMIALNNGKFESAAMIFLKALEPSSASEKYNWGAAYYNGLGNVSKDYEKAFRWFSLAAEEQYSDAEFGIGTMYLNGYYVEKNEEKAFLFFQQASIHENVQSRGILGFCYIKGIGTNKNEEYGFSLFKEAADIGDIQSMKNLAVCYENGYGTPVSISDAICWYKKAVDNGWVDKDNDIGRLEELVDTEIGNM